MCVLSSVSLSMQTIALAASLVFLTAIPGVSAEQAATAVSEEIKVQASAQPEKIIAVPEVATRAMEVELYQ